MKLLNFSQQFRKNVLNKKLRYLPDQLQRQTSPRFASLYSDYKDEGKETTIKNVSNINPGDIFNYSVSQRDKNFSKNAQFNNPVDIIAGEEKFPEITQFTKQYYDDRGKLRDIKNETRIQNEEDIITEGDPAREENLSRNTKPNSALLEKSDILEQYRNLFQRRNQEISIRDLTVQREGQLQPINNLLNYGKLNLNFIQPKSYSVYKNNTSTLKEFLDDTKYVSASSLRLADDFTPNPISPESVLNYSFSNSPLGVLQGAPVFENDTRLANIAAKSLQFQFKSRIKQELEEETIGRIGLFDAATNPNKVIEILQGEEPLIKSNYEITVPKNPFAKVGSFLLNLTGFEIPTSIIPSADKILVPYCFSSLKDDTPSIVGKPLRGERRSKQLLRYSGAGQKAALFSNLALNIYSPDYQIQQSDGFLDSLSEIKEKINSITGFLGDAAPEGNKYVQDATNENTILRDSEDSIAQNKGPEALTDAFEKNAGQEPEMSSYGSLSSKFVWSSSIDIPEKRTEKNIPDRKLSSRKKRNLVNCSILDKTQEIMDEGGTAQFISQLNHAFDDKSVERVSKGSGVKKIIKPSSESSGRNYKVASESESTTNKEEVEFCRTFTKENPFSQVQDLQRPYQLIRRERNSVLARNGNYNIFPSDTNVRNPSKTFDDENDFGGKRATKYMIGIENLAWKDYAAWEELPECEKGVNGGRVMWFPPYGVEYTDRSTANFGSTNFLGRPEPVYTYNYSQRQGQISFTIVVDHPSILNTLRETEFKNLDEDTVDEMVYSFAAGCLRFDIFELAKFYQTFSIEELSQLKETIEEEAGKSNKEINKGKPNKTDEPRITDSQQKSVKQEAENLNGLRLYFPNAVPSASAEVTTTIRRYVDPINLSNESKSELGIYTESNQINLNILKNFLEFLQTDATNGFSLRIAIRSFASPLFNGTEEQRKQFNKELAKRRALSLLKFIGNTIELKTKDGFSIFALQAENIKDDLRVKGIKKRRDDENNDEVVIEVVEAGMIDEAFLKQDYGFEYPAKELTKAPEEYDYKEEKPKAIYSWAARESRRIEIADVKVERNIEDEIEAGTTKTEEEDDEQLELSDLTKRQIAQSFLDKVVDECTYFDYLKETSPIAYQSMKEKLQYFIPSFHSMTPEGLNGRLTFLNQCLRPGDTIDSENGNGCDASNTAFGRPPFLVLRIGDFYNCKIVPNNLDIRFDKGFRFDLNPEGIGVQPMLANVSLQFNIIGGHGLERPVNELQNALSFDYYGNTEMYDTRSAANRKPFERGEEIPYFRESGQTDFELIQEKIKDIEPIDKPTEEKTDIFFGKLEDFSKIPVEDEEIFEQAFNKDEIEQRKINYKEEYNELYNAIAEYLKEYANFQKNLIEQNPLAAYIILANLNFNYKVINRKKLNELGKNYDINGLKKLFFNFLPVKDLTVLPDKNGQVKMTSEPVVPNDEYEGLRLPVPPSENEIENVEEIFKVMRENCITKGRFGSLKIFNTNKKIQDTIYRDRTGTISSQIANILDENISIPEIDVTNLREQFNTIINQLNNALIPIHGQTKPDSIDKNYVISPKKSKLEDDIKQYFENGTLPMEKTYGKFGTEKIQKQSLSVIEAGDSNYIKDVLFTNGFYDKKNLPYYDENNNVFTWNNEYQEGSNSFPVNSAYNPQTVFEKLNYELFNSLQIFATFEKFDETANKNDSINVNSERIDELGAQFFGFEKFREIGGLTEKIRYQNFSASDKKLKQIQGLFSFEFTESNSFKKRKKTKDYQNLTFDHSIKGLDEAIFFDQIYEKREEIKKQLKVELKVEGELNSPVESSDGDSNNVTVADRTNEFEKGINNLKSEYDKYQGRLKEEMEGEIEDYKNTIKSEKPQTTSDGYTLTFIESPRSTKFPLND
jgi:hypothetical protein